ncbi:hypothetical protein GCM10009821_28010 [Aeromicrobium halocynthiae]|uniref:Lipoprotein n=1 Tax=Aeromicrobium halocynthiae TaxID=560557 RepID=A0ABP5HRL6_9ACTN
MRGHWRTGVVAGLSALLLTIAGCTGGGDTEPTPEPEPTETTPTGPPPQPEGADGVTWEIQNWDEYAEDEAVLAYKEWSEAISASVNTGELLPRARELASREVLDVYLDQLRFAEDNDLRSQARTLVRIARSESEAGTSTVVACIWSKSAELVTADGDYFSDEEPRWARQVAKVETDAEAPVLTEVDFDGNCRGEEPPS